MLLKFLESVGHKRTIDDRKTDALYMERYYLIPQKWRWCPNILLHHICLSDKDGFHDHPWANASLVLTGGYWEHTPKGKKWRGRGSIVFRRATALHRLELDKEKAKAETWTLFLTWFRIREWGFIDPAGQWVQWEEYLSRLKAEGNNHA